MTALSEGHIFILPEATVTWLGMLVVLYVLCILIWPWPNPGPFIQGTVATSDRRRWQICIFLVWQLSQVHFDWLIREILQWRFFGPRRTANTHSNNSTPDTILWKMWHPVHVIHRLSVLRPIQTTCFKRSMFWDQLFSTTYCMTGYQIHRSKDCWQQRTKSCRTVGLVQTWSVNSYHRCHDMPSQMTATHPLPFQMLH